MKKNAFVRVCIWTFVTLVLIAILVRGIDSSYVGFERLPESAARHTLYPAASSRNPGAAAALSAAASTAIRALDVDWLSGNLTITFFEGDGGTAAGAGRIGDGVIRSLDAALDGPDVDARQRGIESADRPPGEPVPSSKRSF